MKKILLTFFVFFLFITGVNAKALKKDITTVINDSGVDIESISVSIKDVSNGKVVYSLNDKILMNPASVQKIITTPVSYEILGDDYLFKTAIYSRNKECYILKLGADPYLTTKDLKLLVKNLNKDTKSIFVDDTVLDNKIWGEGWQWDDDLNILMPKFGSYNLDNNLIKLTIIPSDDNQFATIINPSKFPLVFYNHIVSGEKTDINVQRDSNISSNTLILSGTIARPTVIYIPVNDLRRYFNVQLTRLLEEQNIYLKYLNIPNKLSDSDVLCNEVTHDIQRAVSDILKNSNNLVSETLFKLAGKKYLNSSTGTDYAGIKAFNDYCVRQKLDNSRIKMVDASGVSKNNLMSTDFITDFLCVNKNNKIMEILPKPGEGTLTHRMLPLKNNLKAKTGTLSDLSSIAGYLISKNGKKYAFCIIINDVKISLSDKKMLEDYIIREAYLRL